MKTGCRLEAEVVEGVQKLTDREEFAQPVKGKKKGNN